MNVQVLVNVEYRRESGKFASRDEIVEATIENIEGAVEEIYGVGADGDSSYTVDDMSVEEYASPKKPKLDPAAEQWAQLVPVGNMLHQPTMKALLQMIRDGLVGKSGDHRYIDEILAGLEKL